MSRAFGFGVILVAACSSDPPPPTLSVPPPSPPPSAEPVVAAPPPSVVTPVVASAEPPPSAEPVASAAPSSSSAGFGPSGGQKPGVPAIRQGAVTVAGKLPPEVIQRIVRQNYGRFRLCYENGLRTNPKLGGRISVKFTIDKSGSVVGAGDNGSDLPDKTVIACVVRGIGNLSFPAPDGGGTVSVNYPLIFSP